MAKYESLNILFKIDPLYLLIFFVQQNRSVHKHQVLCQSRCNTKTSLPDEKPWVLYIGIYSATNPSANILKLDAKYCIKRNQRTKYVIKFEWFPR